MVILEMKKMQYNINREAAKISALSSGKIDRYEYLKSEEILPSGQSKILEQAIKEHGNYSVKSIALPEKEPDT